MKDIFYRIVLSFMFVFLIIALVISLSGIKGPIQLDNTYYNFMQKVANEYNSWHIAIPNIPTIPTSNAGFKVIIDILNFFVTILNVVVLLLNKIIELILFIVALFKLLFEFKSINTTSSGAISYWN